MGVVKRAWRALTGRRKREGTADLDPAAGSYHHIFGHLKALSPGPRQPKRKRQNILVLQMGKVGSMAISSALRKRDLNVFHTHSLSRGHQKRLVDNLAQGDLTFLLASHELRYLIQNVALHVLVRWYRTHRQYAGRTLKVVTLTRDPTTYFKSSFIQHLDLALPAICAWQAARLGQTGSPPASSVDQARAVQDFTHEVVSIIAATGVEDAQACTARATERWPDHAAVASEVRRWLTPLTWFDTEIVEIFGLDALAAPTFRTEGWAIVQNDWVSILVLRFEQLAMLVPRIGAFAGAPDLDLPEKNVTARKANAVAYMPAINAAIDTPEGRTFIAALRASRYARACGYDRGS